MIAVLVMTDGRRDCIERTIASARRDLQGPITEWIIHEDSAGDFEFHEYLLQKFDARVVVPTSWIEHRKAGFGGAIRSAWKHLVNDSKADFIFHLEDDFTFNRPVDLAAMSDVLNINPGLVQLALRRQPWNDAERIAGGIVEQHPHDFTDRRAWIDGPLHWLEHRRFFTTNPCLYRRSLITDHEWPDGANSEGRFGIDLLQQHPDWRFGYWGSRESGEWVTHIGNERVGVGY